MSYNASEIEVLEGLEPVRKRPAMYIGGTDAAGYHHLLWEIVDNSVDEAINGHATKIEVEIDQDGKGATVSDNGRGIPVDKHPKYKKSALEIILTTLHAGGKFEGKNYQVSGGLHGVGSSVVNALSTEMVATIWREGKTHTQSFSRGTPTSKLQKGGKTSKRGTQITFRPDKEIFGAKASFDDDRIRERLESKTYLHRGLRIVFRDRKGKREEFHHPEGINEYLDKIIANRGKPAIHTDPFTLQASDGDFRIELALQWTESGDEKIASYANGIPTGSGGTHENGLKGAINRAIRTYMEAKKFKPKGVKVAAEDIREGIVAIVSAYVRDPQFQGQTKDRLNNPEVAGQVDAAVRTAMEQWLLANPSIGDSILARIVLAARARQASRAAKGQVLRKSAISSKLNLPGKLSDCSSTDPDETELFLVEGDSAGGNAKQGRDRRTQAILPLRGKVLNAERANRNQILGNKELQNVVTALGCGVGKTFDVNRLRYGKIFLLMDADSDGLHISTLLLTFFFRYLPGLIRNGHVYLAQPPLYRMDVGKQTYWAVDDGERSQIEAKLPKNAKIELSRFKGLGEMTADELWETTLDPAQRRALRVMVTSDLEADGVVGGLMGKDASARYDFIMQHAPTVSLDELDM